MKAPVGPGSPVVRLVADRFGLVPTGPSRMEGTVGAQVGPWGRWWRMRGRRSSIRRIWLLVGRAALLPHARAVRTGILTFISLSSLLAVPCSVSGCRTEFKMRFDVVYMVWMTSRPVFIFSRSMSPRFARTLPKSLNVLAAPHRIRNELQVQVLPVSLFTWQQYGIVCSPGTFSGIWSTAGSFVTLPRLHEEEFSDLHIFCVFQLHVENVSRSFL